MKNNLIKSLQVGPAYPSPCMFVETEPKASPKANMEGYSWSTYLSQPKVHVASPEASVPGSVPLCALPHLGHKGEPLTFAVYRARPGTSLNAALDSAGIFSKHPGRRGGAGAVWTTHGTVRLYKSPSALLCFFTCHHLRLKRLLRLWDEDGCFILPPSVLWRSILQALLHHRQPSAPLLLPPQLFLRSWHILNMHISY